MTAAEKKEMDELKAALALAQAGSKKKAELVGTSQATVEYDATKHQLIGNAKLLGALKAENITLLVRTSTASPNGKLYANIADSCINELMDINYEF